MIFNFINASLEEIRQSLHELQNRQERIEYIAEAKRSLGEFITGLENRKAELEEERIKLEKAVQSEESISNLSYVYSWLFDIDNRFSMFNNKLRWIGIWEKIDFAESGIDQTQSAGDQRKSNQPERIRWMSTEARIITLFELLYAVGLIHSDSYNKRYALIEHHFLNKQNQPFKAKQLSNAFQQIPNIEKAIAELKKVLCSS